MTSSTCGCLLDVSDACQLSTSAADTALSRTSVAASRAASAVLKPAAFTWCRSAFVPPAWRRAPRSCRGSAGRSARTARRCRGGADGGELAALAGRRARKDRRLPAARRRTLGRGQPQPPVRVPRCRARRAPGTASTLRATSGTGIRRAQSRGSCCARPIAAKPVGFSASPGVEHMRGAFPQRAAGRPRRCRAVDVAAPASVALARHRRAAFAAQARDVSVKQAVLLSELLQSDRRRKGEGAVPTRVTSIDPFAWETAVIVWWTRRTAPACGVLGGSAPAGT